MTTETPLTIAIFTMAIIGLIIGVALEANAATQTFDASVTVTNSNPTIDWVNSSFSLNPVADTTTSFQFHFNASDNNGAADLNDSSAAIVIALGTVSTTSTACTPTDDGNTVTYNCSVAIPYYYNASASWTINASVSDLSDNLVYNATETFTLNQLKAISLVQASLSFSGSPGQQDVLASEGAQDVRNIGNYDFAQLNVTAFDLTNASNTISASQFSINTSASGGVGIAMANNTAAPIVGADMTHGSGASESLYVYLDVPVGLPELAYTSANDWIVDVE